MLSCSREVSRLLLNPQTSPINRLGRIDVLVNNAGIGYFKPATELLLEEFDEMWRLNMRAVFVCTKAVLPYTPQPSGHLAVLHHHGDNLSGVG